MRVYDLTAMAYLGILWKTVTQCLQLHVVCSPNLDEITRTVAFAKYKEFQGRGRLNKFHPISLFFCDTSSSHNGLITTVMIWPWNSRTVVTWLRITSWQESLRNRSSYIPDKTKLTRKAGFCRTAPQTQHIFFGIRVIFCYFKLFRMAWIILA